MGLWPLWSKHVPLVSLQTHSLPLVHGFPANCLTLWLTLPGELSTRMTDLGSRVQKSILTGSSGLLPPVPAPPKHPTYVPGPHLWSV